MKNTFRTSAASTLAVMNLLGFILSGVHLLLHHVLGLPGLVDAPHLDVATNAIMCGMHLIATGSVWHLRAFG